MTHAARLLALAAAALAFACGPKMIGRTNIEDTKANREILDVVQAYRNAYERKDATAIVELASPRYLDTRDSISYETLKTQLQSDFDRIKNLQLELVVRKITVDHDQALVHYFYSTSFQLQSGGDEWTTESDDKRMVLAREDGRWKVVSGL